MDKNIRKQLKTDYEELEIKPSPNLWDQIESSLDSDAEIVVKSGFQWLKYAAVAVLLLSAGSLLYFNSDKNSDTEKAVVIKNHSQKIFKPKETIVSTVPTEIINKKSLLRQTIEKDDIDNPVVAETSEKIEVSENLFLAEKENNITEVLSVSMEKIDVAVAESKVAVRKKASYINANDLLAGRELDKTREENHNDERKFGVFDIRKVKGPNSLKIFGFTVISDSVEDK